MRTDDEQRGQRHIGGWSWRPSGREGWHRGRASGGFGSEHDAWRSGVGHSPAGFGFGPEEDPTRGGFDDHDWQPTRPARGRGAWAGDWADDNYRGRGPKGYRRSDDRIREEVCERLTDDWRVDATDVVVQVQDGEVTLSGAVASREQKRAAEECVEHIPGVHDVINQLRVTPATREPQSGRPGAR